VPSRWRLLVLRVLEKVPSLRCLHLKIQVITTDHRRRSHRDWKTLVCDTACRNGSHEPRICLSSKRSHSDYDDACRPVVRVRH